MQSLFYFLRPSTLFVTGFSWFYAIVLLLVLIPLGILCFLVYRKIRDKRREKQLLAARVEELMKLRAHAWEYENPDHTGEVPEDYFPKHWDIMLSCVERGISPGEYWRYVK